MIPAERGKEEEGKKKWVSGAQAYQLLAGLMLYDVICHCVGLAWLDNTRGGILVVSTSWSTPTFIFFFLFTFSFLSVAA
jgi:hypothetical protein